jgi:hypothetical protein
MTTTSTGPITREKLFELAAAPYGEALKEIRKIDPLWGFAPGEKIKFRVTASRYAREEGFATVEAETEEEAKELADKLKESEFSWDAVGFDTEGFEIEGVEP